MFVLVLAHLEPLFRSLRIPLIALVLSLSFILMSGTSLRVNCLQTDCSSCFCSPCQDTHNLTCRALKDSVCKQCLIRQTLRCLHHLFRRESSMDCSHAPSSPFILVVFLQGWAESQNPPPLIFSCAVSMLDHCSSVLTLKHILGSSFCIRIMSYSLIRAHSVPRLFFISPSWMTCCSYL